MRTFSKSEHISHFQLRYPYASKAQRHHILNEICIMFGYHRKHAIRLMNGQKPPSDTRHPIKRGRKALYDDPMIVEVLTDIWKLTNLPGAKRLKAILPLWLPFYEKFIIPDDIEQKLKRISRLFKFL